MHDVFQLLCSGRKECALLINGEAPICMAHLMIGPTGTRTMTRLFAFLLLCIGVQILITGVEDVLGPLFAAR